MHEIVSKIGKVEQLELFPSEGFADVPAETLGEWINTGHTAIKMAVRRLAIHVAQVGAWLVAAKAKCQHGEWLEWLAENCPEISQRTAYNYIEAYDKLQGTNLQLVANLTVTQAYKQLGIVKDPTDKIEVELLPLPEGKFDVIYADPPWEYSNTIRSWGPAELHYPTLPLEEICDYHVKDISITETFADNAALFLWVTNPFLEDAFKVVESWGFEYKTNIVWVKRNLRRTGVGFYVRGWHELLFVCTKGSYVPDQTGKEPIGSVIDADSGEHSAKPGIVYELIEKMYPDGKYLELFLRGTPRTGWTGHGYEATT